METLWEQVSLVDHQVMEMKHLTPAMNREADVQIIVTEPSVSLDLEDSIQHPADNKTALHRNDSFHNISPTVGSIQVLEI